MRIPKGDARKTTIGCPQCNCRQRTVTDCRHMEGKPGEGPAIRRRIQCSKGHRYTTYERPAWAWEKEDGLKERLRQVKAILAGL